MALMRNAVLVSSFLVNIGLSARPEGGEHKAHASLLSSQAHKATISRVWSPDITGEEPRGFPDVLEGVPLCAAQDKLEELDLDPSTMSVTFNGAPVTGSTWGEITLKPKVYGLLGVTEGAEPTKFAWLDPPFGKYGGYVYTDGQSIVGANVVPEDSNTCESYLLTFAPPVDVPELPPAFAVGRMKNVNLEILREAGAKRFTWVHKEEALAERGLNRNAERGGFLYQMNAPDEPLKLIFFEMTGPHKTPQVSDSLDDHSEEQSLNASNVEESPAISTVSTGSGDVKISLTVNGQQVTTN